MPDEIKTLEAQIEQLTKDKEEAIKSEAYEQAGEIKKKQLKKKEQLEKMTSSGRIVSIRIILLSMR